MGLPVVPAKKQRSGASARVRWVAALMGVGGFSVPGLMGWWMTGRWLWPRGMCSPEQELACLRATLDATGYRPPPMPRR